MGLQAMTVGTTQRPQLLFNDGRVIGLTIEATVNYGEFSVNRSFNVFPMLTDEEKSQLQSICDKVLAYSNNKIFNEK